MLKHLAPLALLGVCLFAGRATAGVTRPRDTVYYGTYAPLAYAFADKAQAQGYDVQVVYDLTDGGSLTVYVYTDGQQEWWPAVRYDWFDQRGRWFTEYDVPPQMPSIFP